MRTQDSRLFARLVWLVVVLAVLVAPAALAQRNPYPFVTPDDEEFPISTVGDPDPGNSGLPRQQPDLPMLPIFEPGTNMASLLVSRVMFIFVTSRLHTVSSAGVSVANQRNLAQ